MTSSENGQNIIRLENTEPLSVGGHRSCYPYPGYEAKCIKILHEPWEQIDRRLRDPLRHLRRRRNYDENQSEYIELKKLADKLGNLHQRHFPGTYGFCETDLGQGLVVDRICDSDGATSPTLKTYLWLKGWTEEVATAVDRYWDFLKEQKVMVRDPFPHNLLVQDRGPGEGLRIVQIDGFGSSDFLPFSRWFKGLRDRKLDGRRQRMERQLEKHLADIEAGRKPKGKGITTV